MTKKEALIRVIIKYPFEDPYTETVENTIEAFQEIIGGYIEVYNSWIPEVLIICNEEGKLKGLEPNFAIPGDIIVGPCIFVRDESSEFGSLTDKQTSDKQTRKILDTFLW